MSNKDDMKTSLRKVVKEVGVGIGERKALGGSGVISHHRVGKVFAEAQSWVLVLAWEG